MATKERPAKVISENTEHYSRYSHGSWIEHDGPYLESLVGIDKIEYSDGRRLPNGRYPWKECVHTWSDQRDTLVAQNDWGYYVDWGWGNIDAADYVHYCRWGTGTHVDIPSQGFNSEALENCLRQIDLNCGESVLLYSGVIQAVPLLGSVFRLNGILRKAARRISRDMRHKPFTTVIKSLISADFIDRFVISPTLRDARMFQDATDYVLRTIQTARDRTAARVFSLSSVVNDVIDNGGSVINDYSGNLGNGSGYRLETQDRTLVTSKAFALCEGGYDVDAIDPIKVWARRVGLSRPLDSVWDLVPFSFVVDYFTRAGDFISALSDEMSDVEGLRGTCVKVLDLWGTVKAERTLSAKATNVVRGPSGPWGIPLTHNSYQLSTAFVKSGVFQRFRIPDPWNALTRLQRKIDDYLTVSLDLSSTRKRTIAELVIQAKL